MQCTTCSSGAKTIQYHIHTQLGQPPGAIWASTSFPSMPHNADIRGRIEPVTTWWMTAGPAEPQPATEKL